jgi:hypothetical protein
MTSPLGLAGGARLAAADGLPTEEGTITSSFDMFRSSLMSMSRARLTPDSVVILAPVDRSAFLGVICFAVLLLPFDVVPRGDMMNRGKNETVMAGVRDTGELFVIKQL